MVKMDAIKKPLNWIGIYNFRSFWICGTIVCLFGLWYAPLLIQMTWNDFPEPKMHFTMVASAEQIPFTETTKTENEIGLLALTRYQDGIRVALVTTSPTDDVWCSIIEETTWKKKLKKLDSNKFFGTLITTEPHVGVYCDVNGKTISAYSIYSEFPQDYPNGMGNFIFNTSLKDLSRMQNWMGDNGFVGLPPMMPY